MENLKRFLWSWPFYIVGALVGVVAFYGWNLDKIVGKVGAGILLGIVIVVIWLLVILARKAVVSVLRPRATVLPPESGSSRMRERDPPASEVW